MNYEIKHHDAGDAGKFKVHTGDGVKGELHYKMNENSYMALTHTEVDKELQGSGAASALLDAAADYARKHKHKILTVCSYARAYMHDRHPDKYADVLV